MKEQDAIPLPLPKHADGLSDAELSLLTRNTVATGEGHTTPSPQSGNTPINVVQLKVCVEVAHAPWGRVMVAPSAPGPLPPLSVSTAPTTTTESYGVTGEGVASLALHTRPAALPPPTPPPPPPPSPFTHVRMYTRSGGPQSIMEGPPHHRSTRSVCRGETAFCTARAANTPGGRGACSAVVTSRVGEPPNSSHTGGAATAAELTSRV